MPENSSSLANHVCIPAPLFAAMSRCYFGTGPRLHEPTTTSMSELLSDTQAEPETPTPEAIPHPLLTPGAKWPIINQTEYVRKQNGTYRLPVTAVPEDAPPVNPTDAATKGS